MEVGLAVGGAVLSSALNVFFDRMTSKFPSLFPGAKHADQIFNELKTALLPIEVVLDYAEDNQITNKHVKRWLNEVKDTVYHAEDLVDEINTDVLRLEVEEQSPIDKVSQLSGEFLEKIIPKIKDIVVILKHLESQIILLGLGRGVPRQDNSQRLPTTSLVDESEVYGRDNEREKLVQMMLSDKPNPNNVGVIPIVGMGGSGKTTLAQLVYNDERVMKCFDIRAWVCVSENYDAVKITKTLVQEVTRSSSIDKDEFNMLQIKLKESLREKRFLIVLDDVWNNNYNDWDKLKAPLKYGKQGSTIIVTTRNEKVALTMKNEEIHHLGDMSDEDCWTLFKRHAFDNGGPPTSLELVNIGREILKKCNRLPLAIKTLGGLLRSKREAKKWNDILVSELWTSKDETNDV